MSSGACSVQPFSTLSLEAKHLQKAAAVAAKDAATAAALAQHQAIAITVDQAIAAATDAHRLREAAVETAFPGEQTAADSSGRFQALQDARMLRSVDPRRGTRAHADRLLGNSHEGSAPATAVF